MASTIEKDNERHPSHPVYKQAHADVAAGIEKADLKIPKRKLKKTESETSENPETEIENAETN